MQNRFRYLYSEAELLEWVLRLAGLAERTEATHVLMNNCRADYARRNARELAALLSLQERTSRSA